MIEEGFVAEDAVEGGTADGELTGGAELVATVQVENVLDVVADDSIEREVVRLACGLLIWMEVRFGGQSEVAGKDDAVVGFEKGGFKDAGKLADIAGPVVL